MSRELLFLARASSDMDKQRLLQLLTELHAELANAGQLDPDVRAAVSDLAGDAERLLRGSAEDGAPAAGEAPVAGQFRQRLQEFGVDHPQLAKAINQIADGLANLGI